MIIIISDEQDKVIQDFIIPETFQIQNRNKGLR